VLRKKGRILLASTKNYDFWGAAVIDLCQGVSTPSFLAMRRRHIAREEGAHGYMLPLVRQSDT